MKTVSYPLTDKTWARSYLFARAADDDKRILEYRLKTFGALDKLLKPEGVHNWIQSKQEADTQTFRETHSELFRKDPQGSMKLKLEQSGFEFTTSGERLLLHYGVPGQMAGVNLPSIRGGVTQELRILSEDISRDYGWSRPEATMFIVSGMTPIKSSITWELTRSEIVLRIHPSLPPEIVEDVYRQIKRQIGAKTARERGKTKRGDRARDLFLALFIGAKENRMSLPDDLLKQWNGLCRDPHAWQSYWHRDPPKGLISWAFDVGDVKTFTNVCDRITCKLLDRKKSNERPGQPIGLGTLLNQSPFFNRVENRARTSSRTGKKQKFNIHEVAQRLGVNRSSVYRLVKEKVIPAPKKLNGSPRWNRDEIERASALRKTRKVG